MRSGTTKPITLRMPIAQHDRLVLCTDGVHGFLPVEIIADSVLRPMIRRARW